MNDQPDSVSTEAVPTEAVQRRRFMRGGALLAGAAAGAVAVSAASALPASAANTDPVTVGGNLTGTSTTTLTVNNATVPTLTLKNSAGPTLSLQPLPDFDGTLRIGELVNTVDGPYLGIDDGNGAATTTYLATAEDLSAQPATVAITPERLLDTRSSAGRAGILATSSGAFDSSFRLTANSYIDIKVDAADADFALDGAFLNLTSTGALANGYLLAYPPGTRPNSSTTSYSKGVTIANSCFAALDVIGSSYAVRIYSSATTHVIVDFTGAVVSLLPGPAAAKKASRQAVRARAARRVQRSFSRR